MNATADREINFNFDERERIVEGRTVAVRDHGQRHMLHVLILERTTQSGKKHRHAVVETARGVPIPGKGENSWDCDDDFVYGASFAASDVKEAVRKFMEDVRSTRKRRA